MTPQGNGIVELHDVGRNERGFNCMRLIKFLFSSDKYSEWDAWHGAHVAAARGNCPFRMQCEIYRKSIKNHPARQLELF